MMRDILEKVARSSASGGGTQVRDGNYLFEVKKCFFKEGHKGKCFIVELKVVESKPALEGVAPNAPGDTVSFVCNLTKHASAPGNMKAFVLRLFDEDEAKVQVQELMDSMEVLIGAENPGRGMLIADETYRGTIQSGPNAGKPITLHKWFSVKQTPEEIKARRAKLDTAEKQAA